MPPAWLPAAGAATSESRAAHITLGLLSSAASAPASQPRQLSSLAEAALQLRSSSPPSEGMPAPGAACSGAEACAAAGAPAALARSPEHDSVALLMQAAGSP